MPEPPPAGCGLPWGHKGKLDRIVPVGQGVCESPGRTAGLEDPSHRWEGASSSCGMGNMLTVAAKRRDVSGLNASQSQRR